MLTDKTQESPRSRAVDGAPDSPLVAISILNWNGWQDTLECLESVRRLDYPNYLTVVVDNGSWNGSADKIRAWAEANLGPGGVLADYTRETALAGGVPQTEQALDRAASPARMVLIRNEENLGFTGGNNVSIHYALHRASTAADYVFLLNSDAKLDPQCIGSLVAASDKAGAGIAGAVVTDGNGKVYFAGSGSFRHHLIRSLISFPIRPRSEEFWESPIAYGAAMLISRPTLKAIHRYRGDYLKEELFAYGDEIEFCWVANRLGIRTIIANGARASHDSAKRRHAPGDSRYYFYYATRNTLRIASEHLPVAARLAFHAVYIPLSIRRIMKRIVAGQPHLVRAILSGLFDGYMGVSGKWKHHDEEGRGHVGV
jgi:GT2 family glycosyltransferase